MTDVSDVVSFLLMLFGEPAPLPPMDSAADAPLETPVVAIPEERPAIRLLTAGIVIAGLWWAQVVLIPLVFSILISYALEPIVERLESAHIARPFAVPLLLLTLLGTTGFGVYRLRSEGVRFIERLPEAARTLRQTLQPDGRDQPGAVARVQQAAQELETAAKEAGGPSRATAGALPVRIEEPTFKWNAYLWQGSLGLVELGGQLFVMLCLVYYLLASGDLYKRKLVRIAGPTFSQKKVTVQILEEIDRQIERFLLARLFISVVIGLVLWIGFRLMGLAEAGIWGIVAAVLFVVPYVGPAAVTGGAAVAGLVHFGSLRIVVVIGVLCLTVAAIEGNVLTPYLMSRVGRMNAVAVFVSLLFWGWIWGVWGLLLAVPLMAAAKAVCERIDDLNSYAELLSE